MFEQRHPNSSSSSSVQSYFAQCAQNKARYEKQPTVPRHIEEALEELRLIPIQLEQKAAIPYPEMRVLTDVEHHGHGDGVEVAEAVKMGQSLRVEFSLRPETDAYGFLVRDCFVRDELSGAEHEVIDHKGCSTDLNIFGHPHYDTYHDIARARWHAFKLPDHQRVSLRCRVLICTDLADAGGGGSTCANLPTPPFCPDLVTSPPNSVLADRLSSSSKGQQQNANRRMKRTSLMNAADGMVEMEQSVHFGMELIAAGSPDFCPPSLLPLPLLVALSTVCFHLLLIALFGNLLCRLHRRNWTTTTKAMIS